MGRVSFYQEALEFIFRERVGWERYNDTLPMGREDSIILAFRMGPAASGCELYNIDIILALIFI